MVKIIFCAILILFTAFGSTAFAEERVPTISVSGEGRVEAAPDCATISIGVTSFDRDATKVQNENSRIANDVINSITSLSHRQLQFPTALSLRRQGQTNF